MLTKSHSLSISVGVLIVTLLLAACAPAAASAPASTNTPIAPAPILMAAKSATLGDILTDSKGMSLYMYTKDTPGVSTCYDKCATAWPPLTIAAGVTPVGSADVTAKLGTTKRTDGTLQVTANDWPLYYWAKDVKPGDTTGQNVGTVWFVLDPKGTVIK